MQLDRLERPMSSILQQPKAGWVECPWPCHHHLSTSYLESRELSKKTTAELSFTWFGFVGVQTGKSQPGTWLFQP